MDGWMMGEWMGGGMDDEWLDVSSVTVEGWCRRYTTISLFPNYVAKPDM